MLVYWQLAIPDILDKVFAFLGIRRIRMLRRVCRLFSVLLHDPRLAPFCRSYRRVHLVPTSFRRLFSQMTYRAVDFRIFSDGSSYHVRLPFNGENYVGVVTSGIVFICGVRVSGSFPAVLARNCFEGRFVDSAWITFIKFEVGGRAKHVQFTYTNGDIQVFVGMDLVFNAAVVV